MDALGYQLGMLRRYSSTILELNKPKIICDESMKMMKFEHFKKVVTQLYRLNKKAEKWIDKVPTEVNVAFFDNPYVDAFIMTRDVLIPETLGELSEDVFWLLDEFKEGKDHPCKIDDVEYNVRTLNDFFDSVKSRFEQ